VIRKVDSGAPAHDINGKPWCPKIVLLCVFALAVCFLVGPLLFRVCERVNIERRPRREMRGIREVHLEEKLVTLGGDDIQVKEAAKVLSRFSHITTLSVYGQDITDALPAIASIASLDALYLQNAPISDDGLSAICRLRQLRSLSLSGCTKITDRGVAHLSCLPELRSLFVGNGTQVTQLGVQPLLDANPSLVILGLPMSVIIPPHAETEQ
jgi:hypothetical protein